MIRIMIAHKIQKIHFSAVMTRPEPVEGFAFDIRVRNRILVFDVNCVRSDYQFLFLILHRSAVPESVSFRHYARESGVTILVFGYRYGFRFHNGVVYGDHHLFTDGIPCCDRQLTSYVRPQASLSAA